MVEVSVVVSVVSCSVGGGSMLGMGDVVVVGKSGIGDTGDVNVIVEDVLLLLLLLLSLLAAGFSKGALPFYCRISHRFESR